MNKIDEQLPSVAKTVASTLLGDAHKFCLALYEFMTKTVEVQNFFL